MHRRKSLLSCRLSSGLMTEKLVLGSQLRSAKDKKQAQEKSEEELGRQPCRFLSTAQRTRPNVELFMRRINV